MLANDPLKIRNLTPIAVLLLLFISMISQGHAFSITLPQVLNPGFENDGCPKDQDHLTCGWLINTQDCTFTSVCGNIVSSSSPQGSRMLSLNGTSGQAQQNNDLLSNVTGTVANTPKLEFYVRWNSIVSCQTARTACLFKILFAFNSDTKTVNYFWTNNSTVFGAQITNSSSTAWYSINPQCGTLTVSASFCHYYNPNFMSQLQTYFSNSLTSYGFGSGTGTQHGITIAYTTDLSFGCFTTGAGVCSAANWSLNVDYLVVGDIAQTASQQLDNAVANASGMLIVLTLFAELGIFLIAIALIAEFFGASGGITLQNILAFGLGLLIIVALAAIVLAVTGSFDAIFRAQGN